MRNLLTLLALLLSLQIYAQEKLQFIESPDVIEKAKVAFQEKDTVKALQLINSIDENDSLYLTAIFAKADILLESDRYDELINLCNSKTFFDDYNYKMKIYKGLAILRSGQTENAVEHFKEMLKLYPKSYLVYFNLAVSYRLNKQYEEAIGAFQQSILCNPYYASSHLELAKICYQEDLISQAILCYDTYLLLNPTGINSLDVLIKLDEIVSTKNNSEALGIKISKDDESFQDIDLLIKNYTALNKDYKIPNKIELPLVKQNHALMELLNQFEGNGGFWDQKYVKFYKQLFNSGYFNDFVYYIISSTTNEKYKKILSKNTKNQKEFISWVANTWMAIVGENNTYEDQTGITYSYMNSGEIQSLGKEDSEGYFVGACYFFNKNGSRKANGFYANKVREGHWVWFLENGQKDEEVGYKNGALDGAYIKYTPEGKIKLKTNYANNLYNGDLYKYNQFGVLTEHSVYINDSLNGLTTLYHNLGEKYQRLKIPYEKNKVNGLVEEFYAGGEKKFILNFENGTRIGKEQSFFTNGQLLNYYLYENGNLNGEHKEYYFDGNIYEEGTFLNDNKNGEWKRYYKSGQLYSTTNYSDDGILSGLYEEFDHAGNKTLSYIYKDGDLIEFSFYNKKGEVISHGIIENNKITLNGVYPNGSKMVTGLYLKGQRHDLWQYYNNYGFLISDEKFSQGKMLEDKEYHLNGNLKSSVSYNNGELDGYYKNLYINGTIRSEGYYKDGKAEKTWMYYYPDGTVSNKHFYFHDDLNGNQYDYSVDGKLYSRDLYKEGLWVSTAFYDTSGTEVSLVNYYNDSTGVLKYKNGSKRLKYSYLNGYAHGEFIWYHFNGKIETKGNYFNGDENGYWAWYNDQGVKTTEGKYEYGNKVGVWNTYYDNGKIKSKKSYVNGKLNGEYINYSEDGKLLYEANYFEDEPNGETKYYSSKGELQLIRYYEYGELIGYSYLDKNHEILPMINIKNGTAKISSFYANGNIAREMEFLSGEFNGYYKKHYENGNIASVDQYVAGVQQGESLEYFENGQIKIKSNFLNSDLHGDYTEYYENGQIKEKLHFLNGTLSGLCMYYNEDGSLNKKLFYFNGVVYDGEYF